MKDIVSSIKNNAVAGTWLIAQGFERKHSSILSLIQKYQTDFEELGRLNPHKFKATVGRPVVEFLLNEEQTTFLGTLLRNSPQIIKFKKLLVKEFYRMKTAIIRAKTQQTDVSWIESREKGKVARLEATDAIKEFKIYAGSQGSKNADKYYCNITKMMNSMLFIVEGRFANLRDLMTPRQLAITTAAEYVIDKALKDGMKNKMFYRDIYSLVKERVQVYADLYGKSKIMSDQLLLL